MGWNLVALKTEFLSVSPVIELYLYNKLISLELIYLYLFSEIF